MKGRKRKKREGKRKGVRMIQNSEENDVMFSQIETIFQWALTMLCVGDVLVGLRLLDKIS